MSIFVESFYQLWFVVAYSYRFCPLTPSTRLHMCERINLSVWVESIDIYTYMICAYTWHCTGSYHSSHIRIQNLLKKSTTSEQLLSLVIEVTSGTGMRVTSQHVGLWLPLFAAWNWQQLQKSHVPRMYPCHHVIQQMFFFHWSNNSNTIGTRPTLCKSLALKLQFSSTSSTILRLRVFFPHRKSAERRCFCSDLVSLHVPNPSFQRKKGWTWTWTFLHQKISQKG